MPTERSSIRAPQSGRTAVAQLGSHRDAIHEQEDGHWQRGTNENTNGLLRDYFPKGTDFKPITQARLDAVAAELNGRPRQTLGWVPPSTKFAEAVALTH